MHVFHTSKLRNYFRFTKQITSFTQNIKNKKTLSNFL
nr:MAG TPA: hypothetical protein [Caudoviricetes sp.]